VPEPLSPDPFPLPGPPTADPRPDTQALEELAAPMRTARRLFDEAVAPYREALWRFCLRLTGSAWDAEDLVQETLLKAFGSLSGLWQPVNARAYLFRIASNAWVDHVRRERRAAWEELDAHPGLAEPGLPDERLEVPAAMERLVTLLPPRQRVVVLLCDTLDFRAGEVAAMLGSSEGAVRSLLQRARATLAAARTTPDAAADAAVVAVDRPPVARDAEVPPLVARYVDAFNRRDPDAIAALLHEEAVTTIVGVAEEYGRETTRLASLSEWAADPNEQWVEPVRFDGREALFVFYRTATAPKALAWIITLDTVGSAIRAQREYFFTPELIRHAAAALGVPAVSHGHWYVAPG